MVRWGQVAKSELSFGNINCTRESSIPIIWQIPHIFTDLNRFMNNEIKLVRIYMSYIKSNFGEFEHENENTSYEIDKTYFCQNSI